MSEGYIVWNKRRAEPRQPNCFECPLDYCCHSVKNRCPLERLVDILPKLEKMVEEKEAQT